MVVSEVFFEGASRGPARIVFPLRHPAKSMEFNHETAEWVPQESVEPLKDICEFHHKNDSHYSLQGFGAVTGRWVSIGLISSDAEITWIR